MSWLEALLLGIIQGLTEFLPVSSSGHLEIGKYLFNDQSTAEASLLMTVVLHFATALSTIIVFRKEVIQILTGLLQFKKNEAFYFSVQIVISMIPAIIVGFLLEDQIEALFNQQIILVGIMLLFTAGLLFFADKEKKNKRDITNSTALIIGIAQALAILPGISRSGATISTSILLKTDRTKAARFSFLMVVPLIFGKMAKDVIGGQIYTNDQAFVPLLVGFLAAFITGIIACSWMVKLVQRSKLKYFAFYCILIGIAAILMGTHII